MERSLHRPTDRPQTWRNDGPILLSAGRHLATCRERNRAHDCELFGPVPSEGADVPHGSTRRTAPTLLGPQYRYALRERLSATNALQRDFLPLLFLYQRREVVGRLNPLPLHVEQEVPREQICEERG